MRSVTLVAALVLVLAACGDGTGPDLTQPAELDVITQETLTGMAGREAELEPAVRVLDGLGNPVPNVEVTFTVTAGGGSLSVPGSAATASIPLSPAADGSPLRSEETVTTTTDLQGEARVVWTLGEPGTNRVEATVAGAPPVTFTAEALDPCEGRELQFGEETRGVIDDASCEVGERRFEIFNVDLNEQTSFSVEWGDEGTGWCLCIYTGDQFLAGVPGGSMQVLLPPGSHSVRVRASADESGPFSFLAQLGEATECATIITMPGVAVQGELTASDCAGWDDFLANKADTYQFWVNEGQTISASVQASADVHLQLVRSTSTVDSAEGSDVSITHTAEQGTYYRFIVEAPAGVSYTIAID